MLYKERKQFDEQVDWVMLRMPLEIHRLLEEVPLCVEDRPSLMLMRQLNIRHSSELCGCFHGYPIETRKGSALEVTPTMIMIFREGITEKAFDDAGCDSIDELRRQIRITILHELAHYHGIDEEELGALGFA